MTKTDQKKQFNIQNLVIIGIEEQSNNHEISASIRPRSTEFKKIAIFRTIFQYFPIFRQTKNFPKILTKFIQLTSNKRKLNETLRIKSRLFRVFPAEQIKVGKMLMVKAC